MSQIAIQVLGALLWSVVSIAISQTVSIMLMAWLGLPPKKLVHEIEDAQNPAVGACFFIISLTVAFFVGMFTTNGFTLAESFLTGTGWIVGALALGSGSTALSFIVAHRAMGRVDDESVLDYIKRELILEQNASLAFFLGGLSVVCFMSVIFQTI